MLLAGLAGKLVPRDVALLRLPHHFLDSEAVEGDHHLGREVLGTRDEALFDQAVGHLCGLEGLARVGTHVLLYGAWCGQGGILAPPGTSQLLQSWMPMSGGELDCQVQRVDPLLQVLKLCLQATPGGSQVRHAGVS